MPRLRRTLDPEPRHDRGGGTVLSEDMIRAVFFDVDFTLIYPGPMFRGEGYRAFCARYGIDRRCRDVRRGGRERGRRSSKSRKTPLRRPRFTCGTPGTSSRRWAAPETRSTRCAREIYREWAACQHFELYDDVPRGAAELARPASESAWSRTHTAASRRSSRTSSCRGSSPPPCRRRSTADEATPEHLQSGAAARRTCRRRKP